ncbi:MAG: hypothetical protein LBU90_02520, partial [Bacteroidales bacterium]|nr:hypothetical protein [Bacteroidales bacterium]
SKQIIRQFFVNTLIFKCLKITKSVLFTKYLDKKLIELRFERLNALHLSETEKQNIAGGNLAELLGLTE